MRAGDGLNSVECLGGKGWSASVDRSGTGLYRLRFRDPGDRGRRDGRDRQRDDGHRRSVLAVAGGRELTIDLSVVVLEQVMDEVGR